jgi:transposase
LAGVKKNAAREGRLIVFIDESGVSERPTRVRTWARKGETPVLQFHFNWHQLSLIAGMHYSGMCFRLHDGSIAKEQIVAFLKALLAHLRRPLLIIWDNSRPHRSHLVRDYVAATDGRIKLHFLPGYAPELNPVEFLWGWLKRHALANFCPDSLAELQHTARSKLRSAQRRNVIIASCWQQSELLMSQGYVKLNNRSIAKAPLGGAPC